MRLSHLLGGLALAACASPGTPPGGPVDTQAPEIVRIAPDSGRTGVTPRSVIFRFDEVVSERPAGAASLNALFLISPRDGEPRVGWGRNEIAVRPRRGWKPNTAYTVTLLPGLTDLRGNVRNTGAVMVFSTGQSIPEGSITGTVFDWAEGRILQRALVEARPRADTTTVYVTATDSAGTFTIGNLAGGDYEVRGIADANNNRALDPREAWDSVSVALTDSARIEVLAFVHDSIGARLTSVTVTDSVTLDLRFDNPLSVSSPLSPANVRVLAADSTPVPIISVSPPAADTAVAGRVLPSRPLPPRAIIVKLDRQLQPGADYRVSVMDAVNLMGIKRSSDRVVRIAAPAPPPAAADTTRAPVPTPQPPPPPQPR